jgi:hypothetical protein
MKNKSFFFVVILMIFIISIFNSFTKENVVEGLGLGRGYGGHGGQEVGSGSGIRGGLGRRGQSYFGRGISGYGIGGYPVTTGGFYGGIGFREDDFYYPYTYAYPPPILYDEYGNPIQLTTI